MKLRNRILLYTGVTLTCLIGGIYLTSSRLLLDSYRALEHQDMEAHVRRADMAFDQLSADLHVKAVDWSSWDDAYQFMSDRNKAFIKSNLLGAGIKTMQLDIVMYLDLKGRVFFASPVKRFANIAEPSPALILTALGFDRIRRSRPGENGGLCGVIILRGSPMMVSVRPILTSIGRGPSRGWLIFGRYFDAVALKELGVRTQLNARIGGPDEKNLSPDDRSALAVLKSRPGMYIRPLNSKSVAGWALEPDMRGQSDLLLTVMHPRNIYLQGVKSVQYLMRIILIAGVVFSIVILLTLQLFAFSRLSKLTRQVRSIRGDATLARVDLPGRDELTLLAETINGMLVTLEQRSQDLRESEERLHHQAFHDALTGLPNRALFTDRLELAHARAQRTKSPIAIIFIDLDGFKTINDTLGHEAGDEFLKAIAQRLVPCVRLGDTVARLGGDEFTILLGEVSEIEIAIGVSARILEALRLPIRVSTQEVFASASIGIAFDDNLTDAPDTVLRNADTAMYVAKSSGKGRYLVFDPSMNDGLSGRLAIESDLHTALERGEFVLLFQPLISLETDRMTGVEALLRWNHPTQGMVLPAEFLGIAEDTGLIVPIGYWVLEEACRQLKAWEELHPGYGDFTMNINLSGKQLQRSDVVDRVQHGLMTTGVDPGHVQLEISESVMVTNMAMLNERLQGLKSLGVKLAMDDFGTGHSYVTNMTEFPLDTINIDRAFIKRLTSKRVNSGKIIEAIVALSKALHLNVTGEGVETEQQLSRLRDLGCDIAQGFYLAHPLSAEELNAFMMAGPKSIAEGCRRAAQVRQFPSHRAA